jgi:hypothetical protein
MRKAIFVRFRKAEFSSWGSSKFCKPSGCLRCGEMMTMRILSSDGRTRTAFLCQQNSVCTRHGPSLVTSMLKALISFRTTTNSNQGGRWLQCDGLVSLVQQHRQWTFGAEVIGGVLVGSVIAGIVAFLCGEPGVSILE